MLGFSRVTRSTYCRLAGRLFVGLLWLAASTACTDANPPSSTSPDASGAIRDTGGSTWATTNLPPAANGEVSTETNTEVSVEATVTANANKAPAIDEMVEGLRTRLHKEPGDRDGWVLLARSYAYLNDVESARDALQQARKLGYEGPDFGLQGQPLSARQLPASHPEIPASGGGAFVKAMNNLLEKPAKSATSTGNETHYSQPPAVATDTSAAAAGRN